MPRVQPPPSWHVLARPAPRPVSWRILPRGAHTGASLPKMRIFAQDVHLGQLCASSPIMRILTRDAHLAHLCQRCASWPKMRILCIFAKDAHLGQRCASCASLPKMRINQDYAHDLSSRFHALFWSRFSCHALVFRLEKTRQKHIKITKISAHLRTLRYSASWPKMRIIRKDPHE